MKRKAHRVISGLISAAPCERPKCIPRSRPRGVRALGLRYERALGKHLGPSASHGQWFFFTDANGSGYCQIDYLLQHGDQTVILECKLTNVEAARRQLQDLYLPVARKVFGPAVGGIIVTKYLTHEPEPEAVCPSLGLALVAARKRIPTLHWIGKGPV